MSHRREAGEVTALYVHTCLDHRLHQLEWLFCVKPRLSQDRASQCYMSMPVSGVRLGACRQHEPNDVWPRCRKHEWSRALRCPCIYVRSSAKPFLDCDSATT